MLLGFERKDKQTFLQCFLESVCEECLAFAHFANYNQLAFARSTMFDETDIFSCCTMYYLNKVQCGSELVKNVPKLEGVHNVGPHGASLPHLNSTQLGPDLMLCPPHV
jgi:hypothetical protein